MRNFHLGKNLLMAATSLALAGAAYAATADWTFEAIAFTPRESWCAAPAAQGDPPALEMRPCGEDFPSLAAMSGEKNAARQDLTRLAATEAGKAASEDGKKRVLDVIEARTGGACIENSYRVDPAPMAGVPSFSVTASFICNENEDEPALFDVFTAYAQRRDGTLWTVAFDHPGGPISNSDRAMIKGAIAKISAR